MADATVQVKPSGVEGVEFYGSIDKNKHGNIGSEAPAWYFKQHKENLENDISAQKNRLERGEVPENSKPEAIAELARMRKKLDSINESQPKINGNQKDAIAKVGSELGTKISEAMFTRSDMMKGLADAHEEARRMADPCIKLSHDEIVLAKKAGCRVTNDGMVSRTDGERTWKMIQRSLGENSNSERLRRQ